MSYVLGNPHLKAKGSSWIKRTVNTAWLLGIDSESSSEVQLRTGVFLFLGYSFHKSGLEILILYHLCKPYSKLTPSLS